MASKNDLLCGATPYSTTRPPGWGLFLVFAFTACNSPQSTTRTATLGPNGGDLEFEDGTKVEMQYALESGEVLDFVGSVEAMLSGNSNVL